MVKAKVPAKVKTVADVRKERGAPLTQKLPLAPVAAKTHEDVLQKFYDMTAKFIETYTKLYNGKTGKDITGVHCKFSGYLTFMNNKFNFTTTETIEHIQELVEQGLLEQRGAKGGYVLYMAGTMPASKTIVSADELMKALGE
jgi:hypothetical protein